jgi:hypothetical protein
MEARGAIKVWKAIMMGRACSLDVRLLSIGSLRLGSLCFELSSSKDARQVN